MAVSAQQIANRNVPGNSFVTSTTITGDNNYPAGGYTLTPQMLGFASTIRRIQGDAPVNFAAAAVVPVFIPVLNGANVASIQFQLQTYATGAELAPGTNVLAYSYILTAEGI